MSGYFPYRPRKHQRDIMDAVRKSLEEGGHLVMESSTGSGKTATVLAPALEYAAKSGKRVLYLTRTNAQQRQVIIEFRKIMEHIGLERGREKALSFAEKNGAGKNANFGMYCVGLQGRASTCLLLVEDSDLSGGSPDELGKICRDRKSKTLELLKGGGDGCGPGACRFFAGTCACKSDEVKSWFAREFPFAEEFVSHCRDKSLCAHELNRELAADAILVIAPYIYFFDNFMRLSLLDWMRCALGDLIIVVDEAHNLPEYARTLRSSELSEFTLQAARNEALEFEDPDALKGVACSRFCDEVKRVLLELAKTYVKDEDGLIPPDEFESELMHSFQATSRKLEVAAENLVVIGETIRERRRLGGKLPRSYLYALGSFLFFWLKLDTERFVKLVVGGQNPRLEGYCLDPSLATDILNACHASVHMSGTLRPLEEYRDSLGLPEETKLCAFPSPFPEENLAVFYSKELTTKYETLPRMITKIKPAVEKIMAGTKRSTAFFFPSYSLMENFTGIKPNGKTIVIENRGMGQAELLEGVGKFKESAGSGEGAVLFAVTGGRLSEGLDFPDRELEVVIVVGIPYPKPSARQTVLQLYYDMKFNRGWEYTVKAPTARKLLQSIGRMIRSEKDRGVAVILDSRAVHFKEFIPGIKATDSPMESIRKFRFR